MCGFPDRAQRRSDWVPGSRVVPGLKGPALAPSAWASGVPRRSNTSRTLRPSHTRSSPPPRSASIPPARAPCSLLAAPCGWPVQSGAATRREVSAPTTRSSSSASARRWRRPVTSKPRSCCSSVRDEAPALGCARICRRSSSPSSGSQHSRFIEPERVGGPPATLQRRAYPCDTVTNQPVLPRGRRDAVLTERSLDQRLECRGPASRAIRCASGRAKMLLGRAKQVSSRQL
jgi:hypothetical protein